MSKINKPPAPVPPVVCDFGWYYGITPARLPEASYQVGTNTYPPGATSLTSSATLSATVPFTLNVSSTASFEGSGWLELNNGISHQMVSYTGLTSNTFTGCLGGTGTFGIKTPVFDPRFYVDQMPLGQPITFDAVDSQNLGLAITRSVPGVAIVSYQWSFGNGAIGYGPVSTTEYTYSAAPPSIQASLTVTDSLGRTTSCSHPLNLQALGVTYGSSVRVRQGTGR